MQFLFASRPEQTGHFQSLVAHCAIETILLLLLERCCTGISYRVFDIKRQTEDKQLQNRDDR